MGCTAGCIRIFLDDVKHIELFAETFIDVMNDELYEPLEKEDVISFFDTNGDIMFSLDAEPIFSFGHGYEHVIDFLEAFIQKASDVELDGDFYSDWDNCCDICFLKFEYKDNKLFLMRLFSEQFGMECEECGAEVEMSDVEIFFEKERCLVCPECGARLPQQDDEDYCAVFVDDFILADGEWIEPEGFEATTEGDYYLTDVAPDEVTNAWKYEDVLAAMGVLPDLPTGMASWEGLPRVHAMAEQGDEKAIEILAALNSLETAFSAELAAGHECCDDDCDDCCEDEEDSEEECCHCCHCCHCCEETSEEPEAEGPTEAEPEEENEESVEPAPEKKKSKWWIIPIILILLAGSAVAVQLLGIYDILGLLGGLVG